MVNILNDNNNNKINNYLNNGLSTKPAFNIDNKILKDNQTKCNKRKKILRRTYKVGKNKALNKISVLVSNKSIRNNTTTKKQLFKQPYKRFSNRSVRKCVVLPVLLHLIRENHLFIF